MQPFDESPSGTSGRQIAYDVRRRRYLECLAKRAYLKSGPFDRWKEREGGRVPPRDRDRMGLCDAIPELGLAKLDPGLELVTLDLDKMTDERRNAVQRQWLLSDSREAALGRALLARAHPEREDEIFGWERAGVDPDTYWTAQIHSVHMELPARDRGLRRQRNPADHVPARRHACASSGRGPRLARRGAAAAGAELPGRRGRGAARVVHQLQVLVRRSVPLRRVRRGGEADPRSKKDLNSHEDMEPGQDMTYWSENHRILFATAEYLAGQFWPGEMFISQRHNRKEGPTARRGRET